MSGELVATSKRLSWLLRHGADEAGLAMDEAGWSEIHDVLRVLSITREELDLAVSQNDKVRLVVAGDLIRAGQGHSLAGMPVTREALEASWDRFQPEGPLWHGTRVAAMTGIADQVTQPLYPNRVSSRRRRRAGWSPARSPRVAARAPALTMLRCVMLV